MGGDGSQQRDDKSQQLVVTPQKYSPWTTRLIIDLGLSKRSFLKNEDVPTPSLATKATQLGSIVGKLDIQQTEQKQTEQKQILFPQPTPSCIKPQNPSLQFKLTCSSCKKVYTSESELLGASVTCCFVNLIVDLIKHSKRLEAEKTRQTNLALTLLEKTESLKRETKQLIQMSKEVHEFYMPIIQLLSNRPIIL